MKHANVIVGHVYAVKVGDRIRPVKIERETSTIAFGTRASMFSTPRRVRKFFGTNQVTNRIIGPFTAARCRFEVTQLPSGVWARATRTETA